MLYQYHDIFLHVLEFIVKELVNGFGCRSQLCSLQHKEKRKMDYYSCLCADGKEANQMYLAMRMAL